MATKLFSIQEQSGKPAAAMQPSSGFLLRAKDSIELKCVYDTPTILSELGMPNYKGCIALANELSKLYEKDPVLASAYENSLGVFLSTANPEEFKKRWSAHSLARIARGMAREAVYAHLNISMKRISNDIANSLAREEMAGRQELFDIIIYGKARQNILKMARTGQDAHIEFEKVYAGIGVYRACAIKGDIRKNVYIKEAGGEPDILAGELLREEGVIAPKTMNACFQLPDGTFSEYSIMQDIGDAQGVKRAVSLRALARDAKMSALVLENLDDFWQKLGHAFETCRMLGIQDRHDRNVFVIEKEDGALSIGMIDLDIVACYSPIESYMQAYAGQFHWISASIDFAMEFGNDVRTIPGQIKEVLAWDPPGSTRERRVKLGEQGFGRFLEGADLAGAHFRKRATQQKLRKILKRFDGKPVGWGCSEKKMHGLRKGRERAIAVVNGNIQSIMSKGPNRGRFLLDSHNAWEQGFKVQIKAKSRSFWTQMMDYWKMRLQDWVPDSEGPLGKVVTIAY